MLSTRRRRARERKRRRGRRYRESAKGPLALQAAASCFPPGAAQWGCTSTVTVHVHKLASVCTTDSHLSRKGRVGGGVVQGLSEQGLTEGVSPKTKS